MDTIKKDKKHLLPKRAPSERILYIIVFIIFTIFALFYLYVFIWGFLSGLKTTQEIANAPFDLPKVWHFEHYIEIFTKIKTKDKIGYVEMLFNSVYFAVFGSIIAQFITSLFAYACTKYRFPGSRLVAPLVLIIITLPIYGSEGSKYMLYYNLNFINSYMFIFTYCGAMNMYFLYYSSCYSGISDSYCEAAMVDGANDFQIYFRIMLPQAMGLLEALFVLRLVGEWNNYAQNLLYLNKLPILASGLYMYEKVASRDNYYYVYAGYMVSTLPMLILFVSFNKMMLSNVSIGGVKE